VAPAAALDVFAVCALVPEAKFFIEVDGAPVVAEHRQKDPVQVEFAEGKIEQQGDSFRAVAVVPEIAIANTNAQRRRAVNPVNAIQLRPANEFVAVDQTDAKGEFGVRSGC